MPKNQLEGAVTTTSKLTSSLPNWIGITGLNAAGKGEVVRYFVKLGYSAISLSDLLRKEALLRHLPLSRESLTSLGKELRKQRGSGFLAQLAVETIEADQKIVIESIRHPDEIQLFRTASESFFLFGIDAPVELRFARSQTRGRNENASNVEEFLAREKEEMQDQPHSQQLHQCMKIADALVVNDGDLRDLESKIEVVLYRLGQKL